MQNCNIHFKGHKHTDPKSNVYDYMLIHRIEPFLDPRYKRLILLLYYPLKVSFKVSFSEI